MELCASSDRSVMVIDIPRSIEEAQVIASNSDVGRRIISSSPIETPWQVVIGTVAGTGASPAVLIDELMISQRTKDALQRIKRLHAGRWCLPHICQAPPEDHSELATSRKRKTISPAVGEEDNARHPPYLPEGSRSLHGSIEALRDEFINTAPVFDLMVMDPPWPSKSVRRKKDSYTTAYSVDDVRQLLGLIPVASHLHDDGLVAIWVTNKPAAIDLLKSPRGMFAQWGLEIIGEWIWLKVTANGDPVFNLDSQFRKPWERLLIAGKRGSARTLPAGLGSRVIIAVPDHHSRKPNLRRLFQDVFPAGYRGLEVFARNLTAGWWSWGDQVLMFQDPRYWVDESGTARSI